MPRGAVSTADVTNLPSLPPIHNVFRALVGRELGMLPDGRQSDIDAAGEIRDFCLAHEDTENPSASYNVNSNVWRCFTCAEGGGIRELVIAAGKVDKPRDAIKWLRDNNLMGAPTELAKWEDVTEVYNYTDEAGVLVYQVGRWNLENGSKTFRQRAPKPTGGWLSTLKGIIRVPYNLLKTLECVKQGGTLYVVEGEKDANRLNSLGLTATTNAQGAEWKWPADWANYFTSVGRIILIADNDDAGRKAAQQRASICALACTNVRVLTMPDVKEKGDVSDWLDAGGDFRTLESLADSLGVAAVPHVKDYPEDAVAALVERMTDTGNGQWFAACSADRVIYLTDQATWMFFDGQRWTENGHIEAISTDVVNKMRSAAQDYDGQKRDDLIEHAESSEAGGHRRAMVEIAKGEIYANSSEFDKHKSLLNVQNGVLDLLSLDLLPHMPEQKLTKISDVEYDDGADCPNFKAWLLEAFDNDWEMVSYIQQIMGSILEGRYGIRRMFFAYGPGGTGKSTITHVMSALLGDYATTIDFASLSQKQYANGSGPSPDIAKLRGARLIAANESHNNDRLDTSKLKAFMGGDQITARNLNQGMIKFRIEGAMFFSGNELPNIEGDEAFWSKLKTIPFNHRITRQDLNFFDNKLRPELPGILNFAIAGFQQYLLSERELPEPAKVKAATEDYKQFQDPILEFLSACTETTSQEDDKTYWIGMSQMFTAYRVYCEQMKIKGMLERRFSMSMRHSDHEPKQGWHEGRSQKVYKGIRLKQSFARKVQRSNTQQQDAEF